ncbi:Myg1 protein [Starmerella bacillaris]|uniref:Myg1 protein n=1 Tax=Starmerella bacillaris TaxID=1247836 RepID=A0AAV5RIN3_STABA|nr:Myg1 protein [Starmerella bacillaris]
MTKIGTHSGHFHADEALAVWMLRKLPQFSKSTVIRSRNLEILDTCDIVVDVGARYEPPKYFDHHQREFTETFDKNHTVTKLSSAGLIYKHFGKEVLTQILNDNAGTIKTSDSKKFKLDVQTTVDGIYERVYNEFVEAIDGDDNGVSAYTQKPIYNTRGTKLGSVVANLSPLPCQDNSDENIDRLFQKASDLMGLAFEAQVLSTGLGWYPSKTQVSQAFKDRFKYDSEGRILVLDSATHWKEHLTDLESKEQCVGNVLYVLYPTSDSTRVQAVAKEKDSFESRKALPQEWRGIRDDELSKVTGIPGCVFVHASGFIGGNKTFEGALELAQKALTM